MNCFSRLVRFTEAKLPASPRGPKEELLVKTFATLVLVGEITVARKLLDQRSSRGVLPLSQSTIN